MYHPHRVIALALLLSLTPAFHGCERFKSADSLYQDAQARHQKGDEKATIIQLKSALQKDPKHLPSRLLSAKAYNAVGDFVAAEKEARKAIELGATNAQAGVELARALLGQGQLQKVLGSSSELGLSGESLAQMHEVRGIAQLGLNQLDAARESFAKAIEAAPNLHVGYLGKARVAMVGNDINEAMQQVEVAQQKDPKAFEPWLMKGDLLALQNKSEQAIAAYQMASKANPYQARPFFRIANLYLAQNKSDEVVKAVQAAQKVEPGNLEARFLLARNDFQQKKYKEAKEHILAVLRLAPDHIPSLLLGGAISAALGETELAEKNLKRVIAASPDSAYPRALLAATYLQKGQTDLVIDVLNPVMQADKPDERVLTLLGQAYLAKGETAQAAEMFDRASRANPQNAEIRTRLGSARLAQGNQAQAIADLEAASAMDAKQSVADLALVINYMRNKQFDKALAAIDVLDKKQPNNPVGMNLRGGIYLAQGDTKKARESFELALKKRADYLPAAQNLAQMDLRENNLAAARKRFESVLAKDGKNLGAFLALADLALREQNEKGYVEWLTKALAANPEQIVPRAYLVEYHLKHKQPQEALRLANEAISANPGSPVALELLARVQFSAGDKESGLLSYQKLVQLNPQSAEAQLGLGLAEAEVNHVEAAGVALRKALQLKPAYREAVTALVSLQARDGRFDEAIKSAQNFQKDNPKLATGYALEAGVYFIQQKPDMAIALLQKAQSVQPDSGTATRLYQMRMAAKRPAEADKGLQVWLEEHPKDLSARLFWAEALMGRKENKAAIAQYETAQKLAPNNLLLLNNLAVLYQMQKDPRALTTAEQAYKLRADAPQIADTYGWILLEQGQTAKALDLLRKAATGAKDNLVIGYHYGAALAKSGDKAAARKQIEAVLSSGKSFPEQEQAKALLKQL